MICDSNFFVTFHTISPCLRHKAENRRQRHTSFSWAHLLSFCSLRVDYVALARKHSMIAYADMQRSSDHTSDTLSCPVHLLF